MVARAMTRSGQSAMRHGDWMTAAELEYDRLHALLVGLSPEEWARPTDCSEWDVRQVVAHLIGAAEATASLREARRQQKAGSALRRGEAVVDGMNAVQVQERSTTPPSQLVVDLADAARRGVRARGRLPAPVRALRMPFGPPLGVRSVGYLMDRIYTRDAWLHRIDTCRATGREPVLTADHDGRIVADVVREWARAHGQPYGLTLTGPAGGHWATDPDAPDLTMDAVQLCRVLSGRAPGQGLLAHPVPF